MPSLEMLEHKPTRAGQSALLEELEPLDPTRVCGSVCPHCGGEIDTVALQARAWERTRVAFLRSRGWHGRQDWLEHKNRDGRGPRAREGWEYRRKRRYLEKNRQGTLESGVLEIKAN